ncbi:MAG: hypothetical protein JNK51_12405 [Blastocatellia bacterium]|nr:hypothetical protein [Chloracidobacterium sp.]MBL8185714.1 hypothetical protein [Blastocatellia bacterium]HRJ88469.1 hypothetical protein [Pyrinomonadaceae bacterium]HRK50590.1 hypothetical protein [Pyrinomonadaceae bacterium]
MNLKNTRLHILRKPTQLSACAKTGVSLHCHTEHSKEMLDFVPHYAEKLPIIAQFWKRERDNYLKKEGKGIDFSSAYWSPPMNPDAVYEIEKKQINDTGIDAIVSLTDHDSIDATLKVNETEPNTHAPISMEWTVPFEYGYFHVGVHNLPKARAVELTKTLLDYTFIDENHTNEKLAEMFAMLNEIPSVLVILNHPLWDIELVGKERHEALLKDFIRVHGKWIHAFEINGFRAWSENKAVIEMAESLGMPIATGGDRHGCKPNTVINLTNASTFDEFVDEIRGEKRSEVVLMPEYEHPIHSRQLQSFSEILNHYPEFPDGRQRWFDRVYFDVGDGHGLRQLSVHWQRGGPTWLRWAIWTLGVLGSPKVRPVFRLARKKRDRVPKHAAETRFEIPNVEEVAHSLSSEPAS